MTGSPAFLTRPPNIAHMEARHTLKCDIYEFNSLRNRCYRYTTFQWWCGFSISICNRTGNATEPWILCEPECTWQTNSINKTATGDRLDSCASWHRRGIELVFKGGSGGWRGLFSAPLHLLFGAVYRSQGRRGFLDGLNVALVRYMISVLFSLSHF